MNKHNDVDKVIEEKETYNEGIHSINPEILDDPRFKKNFDDPRFKDILDNPSFKEYAKHTIELAKALSIIRHEVSPTISEIWDDFRQNTLLPLLESISPVMDGIRLALLEVAKLSKPISVVYVLSKAQYVMWDMPDIELQELVLASTDINKTLSEYHQNSNYSHIADTAEKCLAHPLIIPYSSLFKQSYDAFAEGKTELSCMGLVPIIDGLLPLNTSTGGMTNFKKRVNNLYDKVIQNEELATDEYNLFILYTTFKNAVDILIGSSDFSQPEPDYLNRHWLMHGRSVKPKTKLDCIKLINIVYGMILLQDLANSDASEIEDKMT